MFDGIATFTARVEAETRDDAAALVRDIQGNNPDWLVEGVTITEFSWGENLGSALKFVHDDEDTLPSEVLDPLTRYSDEDVAELRELVQAAMDAAEGDSNDAEIEALQRVMEKAVGMLRIPGVTVEW
ncbi:hypothetical protein ACFOOK_26335 [Micromonospora krabiensis]|uniref:hypothetical protein n=1 Tax=Micromonospora krabiensis TaxID=307121 RepID=UPI0012FDF8E8|nr:hypothetical protein [Micromonospora krabiensis]